MHQGGEAGAACHTSELLPVLHCLLQLFRATNAANVQKGQRLTQEHHCEGSQTPSELHKTKLVMLSRGETKRHEKPSAAGPGFGRSSAQPALNARKHQKTQLLTQATHLLIDPCPAFPWEQSNTLLPQSTRLCCCGSISLDELLACSAQALPETHDTVS